MTDADRPGFAVAMLRLTAVFGGQLDDIQVEEYFRALHEYGEDEVQAAVSEANKRLTFRPKPAELIEFIQERRQAVARAAERERQARRILEAAPPTEAELAANKAMIRQLLDSLDKRFHGRRDAEPTERGDNDSRGGSRAIQQDETAPIRPVNGPAAAERLEEARRQALGRFAEHWGVTPEDLRGHGKRGPGDRGAPHGDGPGRRREER